MNRLLRNSTALTSTTGALLLVPAGGTTALNYQGFTMMFGGDVFSNIIAGLTAASVGVCVYLFYLWLHTVVAFQKKKDRLRQLPAILMMTLFTIGASSFVNLVVLAGPLLRSVELVEYQRDATAFSDRVRGLAERARSSLLSQLEAGDAAFRDLAETERQGGDVFGSGGGCGPNCRFLIVQAERFAD